MNAVDNLARSSPDAERRLVFWLFILMAAAFSIVQEGAITSYDGQTVYAVTRSIVERHTFAVSDEFHTLRGTDGRAYSRYGLGLSLVAMVPYLAVRPIAVSSGHAEDILEAAASFVMAFVAAALVVAVYELARRLGAGVSGALLVSVGSVAGTFVLPYVKEFFSEPLTAICIVVAIERLLARRSATAGLAFGAAVLVRAQSLLFAPVLVLVAWWQDGLRAALRATAGAVPGIAATFAYNIIRFGHPFRFGYEGLGFTTPLLTGTAGLLFHPAKSLFLFAPITVLVPFALWRLWGAYRVAFVLITANLVILFATVAMWYAWYGGWCWGPRLLIPGLMPTIAALGPWLDRASRRRAAASLFAVGFAVSFAGVIVPTQAQQLEVRRPSREARYMPSHSPSPWRQFELIPSTTRYSVEHRYKGLEDGRNYLRYLSLWQVGAMRKLQRKGLIVSLILTMILFLVVMVSGRRVRAAVEQIAADSRNAA
jgi:hypothetical protein